MLAILSLNGLSACAFDKQAVLRYNTIDYGSVTIGEMNLGDSTKKVVKLFGAADSMSTVFNEMEEENTVIYHYAGCSIELSNGHVSGFDINQRGVCFYDNIFCVGDGLTKLKSMFPNSYENWKDGKDSFKVCVKDSDSYVVIGILNKKITNIYLWHAQ